MAIEKRKYTNRTTYRAYWRNPYTGKVEKGPARDTLREAKKDDAQIKYQLEFETENFLPNDFISPVPGERTLDAITPLYLQRPDIAESTRKNDYFHYRSISEAVGHIPIVKLDREDMKRFEASQRSKGIKQNTIHRRIGQIRAILNWAVDQGLIPDNPVAGYRCKRGEDLKIPPPSPAEVRLIIEHSPPHLQRAVILAYYLGVRVGETELLSLKWEDFDVERHRLRVWSAQKNKKMPWRDLEIVDSLYSRLLEWNRQDRTQGITHLVSFKGKPVKSIKRSWKTVMDGLKASKLLPKTRRIRPYDLRHAFATETIAAGADPLAVAERMGHSDTAMLHHHYQHILDEQRRKVAESVPDVLNGVQQRGTKQSLSGYFSYPDKYNLQ